MTELLYLLSEPDEPYGNSLRAKRLGRRLGLPSVAHYTVDRHSFNP
jgi:hypothetical protein